jgi:hypothetical protein
VRPGPLIGQDPLDSLVHQRDIHGGAEYVIAQHHGVNLLTG